MPLMNRGAYARPDTALEFNTGTWRVERPIHAHRTAPCAGACPAGEDPQAWLALVADGKTQAAWEALVRANPMPAITGRICPHPCEVSCNRGSYDEPLAIHSVERFLGDEAIRYDWTYPAPDAPLTGQTVAVVGAGPAGLSASWHLRQLGHQPVLFEALVDAGGTVRTAIPGYRMPDDVLNAELERLLGTGIDFRRRHRLGRDMSLEELRAEFGAVFLAPGMQRPTAWSADGVVPEDLHSGLDILREWLSVGQAPTPSSAAVIGGGNTAVDAARVLRRAGVAEVHVVTHYAMPGPNVSPDDVMGAIPREIEQAQEEGVIFHEHRGVRRLLMRTGQVVGLEMVHMRKLTRDDGRRERVPFSGTESVLKVDYVVPAIGQAVDPEGLEALLNGSTYLTVSPWGEIAGHPGLFAGGDARRGPGIMSSAVGDGRRAALAIDRYFQDLQPLDTVDQHVVAVEELNLNYFEPASRVHEPILPPSERRGDTEIESGIEAHQALAEAQRCFSCGNCMACDNCWTLCPDSAVLKTRERASDGSHYIFDYEYCKGCGLCANECPCGYIAMVDEP
jgi:NADPH-dependent glutamate synthase beta subunit-like oxidoreductase